MLLAFRTGVRRGEGMAILSVAALYPDIEPRLSPKPDPRSGTGRRRIGGCGDCRSSLFVSLIASAAATSACVCGIVMLRALGCGHIRGLRKPAMPPPPPLLLPGLEGLATGVLTLLVPPAAPTMALSSSSRTGVRLLRFPAERRLPKAA